MNEKQPSRTRWMIFSMSCGTSWFLYLHRYAWGYIRPELGEKYGFSNTELGTIESMFSLPYALAQIPSGIVCDVFGAHLFVGGSIVVWSIMLAAIVLTGNFYLLCGIRALFGLSQAGTYPSLAKVTKVWFPPQSRTAMQGWIASFFGRSGAAMSPIILAGVLMGYFSLSLTNAILILAVCGVVYGIVFLKLFRSTPESDSRVNQAERLLIQGGDESSESETEKGGKLTIKAVATSGNMCIFILQQIMNAGADVVFVSLLVSYFRDEMNIDIKDRANIQLVALYTSLPLLGGALGGMFGGYLNDWAIRRSGNRRWSRSLIACSGKIIAGLLIFVVIQQSTPLGVALALFATKFFTDWTQPTVWGTCTDIGGRFSGTIVGVINMSGNLGATVMPIVFGIVLDRCTREIVQDGVTSTVTSYTPVMWIVAGMFLVSGVCWLLIDCTKSLDTDSAAAQS